MSSNEQWFLVPGHDGRYQVSTGGRVRSATKILKQTLNDKGYWIVTLTKPKRLYRVHRLMAAAFLPNPDELPLVRHLDDDKDNNTLDNLAWGTVSDNQRDSVLNGTHASTRKTHCKRNHEFTPENTRIKRGGGRICRECRRLSGH